MFDSGRTECVRSASVEGLDFVNAAKEWRRGARCAAEGGQNKVEVGRFHALIVAEGTHDFLLLSGTTH